MDNFRHYFLNPKPKILVHYASQLLLTLIMCSTSKSFMYSVSTLKCFCIMAMWHKSEKSKITVNPVSQEHELCYFWFFGVWVALITFLWLIAFHLDKNLHFQHHPEPWCKYMLFYFFHANLTWNSQCFKLIGSHHVCCDSLHVYPSVCCVAKHTTQNYFKLNRYAFQWFLMPCDYGFLCVVWYDTS